MSKSGFLMIFPEIPQGGFVQSFPILVQRKTRTCEDGVIAIS